MSEVNWQIEGLGFDVLRLKGMFSTKKVLDLITNSPRYDEEEWHLNDWDTSEPVLTKEQEDFLFDEWFGGDLNDLAMSVAELDKTEYAAWSDSGNKHEGRGAYVVLPPVKPWLADLSKLPQTEEAACRILIGLIQKITDLPDDKANSFIDDLDIPCWS